MVKRLENPEQLTAWLEEEDILFRLSLKEGKIILGYLEGSGYSLQAGEGTLFLCDDVNDTREKTGMDDVVNMACEANYELIEQTAAKISNAEVGEDTKEEEDYLASLMRDEAVLDAVFKHTRYQKEIDQMLKNAPERGQPPASAVSR